MIKFSILLFTIFLAVFSILEELVEAQCPQPITRLKKKYQKPTKKFLVLLKTTVSNEKKSLILEKHLKFMKECWGRVPSFAFGKEFYYKSSHLFVFSGGSLEGYSGLFDPLFVEEQLRPLPEIQLIEKDTLVSTFGVITDFIEGDYNNTDDGGDYTLKSKSITHINPTFNLDRIDQAHFSLDRKFSFPSSAGSDVNIYVLDTGINIDHKEFGGRASIGGTFCIGCESFDDNGHGTHIAGIIGGETFGVARKSRLISVKVLNSFGNGRVSEVIAGIAFVLNKHKTSRNKNTVVNMSFGGDTSEALNYAVRLLTNAGIHVVAAAGNDGDDACDVSPASAQSAITVGAIEHRKNIKADFSNFGRCVDIFAPGVDIISASSESNTGRVIFSGTSQAAPHITGTIALIIGEFGNSHPSKMAEKLIYTSTKNVINDLSHDTPNRLVLVPN
ncbi:20704_t:CDS:1 [Entrophospora sp. SA101]|nr:4209_t:CDS:1 [Entrophospora sp. SA101]CAJ0647208.1 4964_t:CDS:1 [Entrophospora sp. SA101]CAJ0761692.1 20704_t:CDS:1 [Entrophospora sp. SA101]CAJ0831271.1 13344_t:CDS:1 [Entrophospora sp. SA101]CAJ0838693.1 13127_t:CDS:1 [Entrophospora sp. SA101]